MKSLCSSLFFLLLIVGRPNGLSGNERCCDENYCAYFATIGANYSYLNFQPSGESSMNGNLGGVNAAFDYRPLNAFYGEAKLDWRQGGIEGADGKRDLIDIDVAGKLGYTTLCYKTVVTWYSGFGFRYLRHHLFPATSEGTFVGSFFPPFLVSAQDLTFSYCEFYVPLGFASQCMATNCLAIGLNVEWMPQVFPTVKIAPLAGAYWELSNEIGNILIQIPITLNLRKCWGSILVLSPFYERWNDGHSQAKTSSGSALGLPANTYNFAGFDLNWIFTF